MRIVALLTVRNEERVLGRCLEHLHAQGIETCVIDNESTDGTRAIAERFLGRGVFRVETLPYPGSFELFTILRNEERLADEIEADWFVHHDADEIREAPAPYRTLHEGLEAADRAGANAVHFDELVFLPTSPEEAYEGTDFVREMRHYYFFEPAPLRRVNAWKKLPGVTVTLRDSGGHSAEFPGRVVHPEPFVMRHYIFLSRAHALAKYAGRVYSAPEVDQRGWHGARATFSPEGLRFPPRERLKRVTDDGRWDRSDPWRAHEFFGSPAPGPRAESRGDEPARAPVPFLVGVARSGTTLLRLMLDAHPALAIPPETHFIPELLRLEGQGKTLREGFFRVVTAQQTWADFQLTPEAFREALAAVEPFTVAEGLRRFYALYAARFRKPRYGDKTPPYVTEIASIERCLPEARFVHVVRDGRDVALSLGPLWFGPGKDVEAQAANWVWRIREARQQAQTCRHYLEVRHEDLVVDPEAALKRLCAFLELDWNPAMLEYHRTAAERLEELADRRHPDGSVRVPKERLRGIFVRASSPPDPSRNGRWRTEMSPEDRRRFEAIAGDMLRDLGYEC